MSKTVGVYVSDERSETANGMVVYVVNDEGKRVRLEIAPDMIHAFTVPVVGAVSN